MADPSLNVDALISSNLSGTAQSALTPQMKDALGQGLSVVSDLVPAYNMIDTLAKGGTPDPQSATMALAGLATVASPLAGAAIMAAGALAQGIETELQDLFTSLGLIDEGPKPVQYIGLVRKGKPIVSDPTAPQWWPWESFARVYFPVGGNSTAYAIFRPDSLPSGNDYNADQSPESQVAWALLYAAANSDIDVHDQPNHFAIKGQGPQNSLEYEFYPLNSFEKFFFAALRRDLEYWANGLPWIDPRSLLHAAVKAWNDKHAPAPGAAFTYAANEQSERIIPLLLSSRGDVSGNNQQDSIPTINGGVTLQNPPRPQPGQTITTVHVPATNAAPAVSYHILTAVKPGQSAQNAAFSTVYAKYIAQGMTPDQAIAAATSELQGVTGSPVQKVTVAQPLSTGMTTGAKAAIGLVLAAGLGAMLLGRKG